MFLFCCNCVQLNAVCQNPTDWLLLCNYVVCFLYVINFSLARIFLYIASFDLWCYRRTFLFQVHVVEVLQSAVLSYSNFYFADHSVGLSKIKCVAEMTLFVLVFGVPSQEEEDANSFLGRGSERKVGKPQPEVNCSSVLNSILGMLMSCRIFL